jgi:hypothetical protein
VTRPWKLSDRISSGVESALTERGSRRSSEGPAETRIGIVILWLIELGVATLGVREGKIRSGESIKIQNTILYLLASRDIINNSWSIGTLSEVAEPDCESFRDALGSRRGDRTLFSSINLVFEI